MKEEITKLCNLIVEHQKCKNCGGAKYEDGCCLYCQTEDKEMTELVSKASELIDNVQIDADILLSLKKIEFVNCEKFKNILKQNNFDTFLKNKFDAITDKIRSNQINEKDLKYIYYFIDNKHYTKENNEYIMGFVMSKIITGDLNLSVEEKMEFVKYFTEVNIQAVYPTTRNPKCIYEEEKDYIGASFYNTITLNKKDIERYLETKNYVMLLIIIFHESSHCFQKYQMKRKEGTGFATYVNLLNAKEEIIHQKCSDYYDENYKKFSHEVDARYKSYELTLMYLDSKGFQIGKEGLEWIKNQMENDYKMIFDETRTYNGQTTSVDEMFASIDVSYETFQNYPVLGLEYKFVDGKMVQKSKEEIESDYSTFIPSTEIDYLYKKLSDKAEAKII